VTGRADPSAPGFAPDWLDLREPADGAARSGALVDRLRTALGERPLEIHDLGSGTGSMARWLAPRLPGPQHWVLHDRDPGLLDRAAAALPAGITAETRAGDLTRLDAADLAGASLVTASALLDLLTAEEVTDLVQACVKAGSPALFALTVAGQVEFATPDPLDAQFAEAFNAHQRRVVDGRRLLGPDAAEVAAEAFGAFDVHLRPSPWRLGAEDVALAAEWLRGWVAAAVEAEPDLPGHTYLERRLSDLQVVVHHTDLLAIPKAVR
jgi:hypothetical protein